MACSKKKKKNPQNKVIKINPFMLKNPQYIGDKVEIIYRREDDKKNLYRHKFKSGSIALYDDGHIMIINTKKKIRFSNERGIL
jgi:hypothetical protein